MIADYADPTAQQTQTAHKSPNIAIIGIGTDYRRDDAAGLLVARALKGHVPSGATVHECAGASFELIDLWVGADLVILVDAVCSGAGAGTIYHIEVRNAPIPSYFFHYSTHGFNLADTIELARLLGKLPPRVVVFGVEGADFAYGAGLSEDIAPAIERLAASVLDCALNYMESEG
ncbi:MAG: hydrogenase maturation protease [Chloroflexota bacterium]